jgi:hypothetical protein
VDITFVLYFVIPSILGVVITLAGAILLAVDARRKAKERPVNTADWLPTGGKVTSVQLGEADVNGTYAPKVNYAYTVYQGFVSFPGKRADSKNNSTREILEKYKENMYLPARYNPKNPSESVLENLPRPMNYVNFFGWLLAGFGIISCCFTMFMAFIIFSAGLSYN